MALDKVDIIVLGAITLLVLAYFGKDFILGGNIEGSSAGFTISNIGGKSRNLIETLSKNNKNCLILYGSQTGTAEDYSNKFSREISSRFGLRTLVGSLSDFDYDNFNEVPNDVLIFFILATYGEGEPTDDAVEFFDYLDNEADELSNIKYCVFGLGNTTYEFYNEIGKKCNKKLQELGGEPFGPFGLGDDGVGTLDEDFLKWKDDVFENLRDNLGMEEHEMKFEPSFELSELDGSEDVVISFGEPDKSYLDESKDLTKGPFNHSHPYLAPITLTKDVFTSAQRNCIHAEFDLSGTNLRYTTGDHLAIWPSNSDYNIDTFVKCFDLQDKLDVAFNLKPLDSTVSIPFPTPVTYGAVIRHYLEISGPISRQLFSSIASFAPNESVKAYSIKLGSNRELFHDEIHIKKYNIADALLKVSEGAKWDKVPFEFIIESISHLQPRYYSISSSSLSEKTSIHVTAVVESEKIEDRYVTGVVTNLLRHVEIEQNHKTVKPLVTYDLNGPRNKYSKFKLPVHVRRSTFKLPSSPSTPIICIGPGTGVAPFRGFIRERVNLRKASDSEVGKTLLFYGCRNSQEDFLYKQEWPEYGKVLGDSFEMFTAFSREGPNKVYVQDLLKQHSDTIAQLIKDGAFIYVCGDASKMARDVQKALTQIIADSREIHEDRAADIVRSFKTQNRYQEDVW